MSIRPRKVVATVEFDDASHLVTLFQSQTTAQLLGLFAPGAAGPTTSVRGRITPTPKETPND